MSDTKETVKAFILEQFLPGEDPSALTEQTPLITGGILDSISILMLVSFLEEHYQVRLEPHEVSGHSLETLGDIARIVESKL